MTMPRGPVIGLLHPGEMGAAVGKCLTGRGHPVLWASEGRSPETAARAGPAGLTDVGSAAELAGRADVIFSICPPHAALDVAWTVQGFTGLFVDANAVSPATARAVALLVEGGGASYVDGGIIGPPPVIPGSTRLYLSGPQAEAVRLLFAGTPLDARIAAGGRPLRRPARGEPHGHAVPPGGGPAVAAGRARAGVRRVAGGGRGGSAR